MKNKVVIITGASSGIGKACAWHFAKNGSKVVLAARNIKILKEIGEEMISNRYEILTVKSDVSVESDCKDLISKTISKFNRIDVLINNAGHTLNIKNPYCSSKDWSRILNLNFLSCSFFCCKELIL